MTTLVQTRPVPSVLLKAIEGSWLLAIVLVPLAIAPEGSMAGFVQIPKVFVLRSIAVLLVTLLAFEWALRQPQQTSPTPQGLAEYRRWLQRGFDGLRARALMLAALGVLLANLVALLFSPVKTISIWGIDAGWDSYGLFSVTSYLVFFAVVATHLKTRAQLERLVWVLTAASILLSLYGFGQHFGFDWFNKNSEAGQRILLTFGNPIFGPAWLVMTVPLTLAMWQSWRDRMATATHVWLGSTLIVLQIVAFMFTASRGPLIGITFGMLFFLAMFTWVFGRRAAIRPAASIAIAVAMALLLNLVPVNAKPTATGQLVDRVSSIGAAITPGGGLGGRYLIWSTAADVYFNVPWMDNESLDTLPDLGFEPLRRLVGYGPDMFGYAYALRADPLATTAPGHGHNFVVHTAVELGLLGVLAYSALTIIVAWTLLRMLLAVKRGSAPLWLGYLVIGLSSVLAGRTLEQMGGKAQIADILLSWVLIGVVVTLAALFASGNANELSPPLATNEAKPETGQRRRRGARRAERRSRSSNTALRPFHIAGAVVVALAALVFWSQTIFPHVRSAITLANGQDASDQGRPAEAFLLLQKSVEQSPSSAFAHLTLGAGLHSGAKTEPDAETQRIALERAYAEVRAVIDRNPLDGRAWNLAAQIGRDQALIATGVRDQLITDSETLVQLLPSRWEPRLQLAQARGMFGEHALALEAVQEAKALGGTSGKNVGFLFLLEATALRALGRVEEANVVIEQLAGLPDAAARGFLVQLTGGAGQ